MAVQRALVLIGGSIQQLPTGDTLAGAGGGGGVYAAHVDIDVAGQWSLEEDIAEPEALTTSVIMAVVAGECPTGHYPDELELEPCQVFARCVSDGTLKLRLVSQGRMYGKRRVRYLIPS